VSSTVSGLPETHYAYDSADRVTSVTQGSARSRFTYDPAGNVKTQSLPGGILRSNEYSDSGGLTGITYTAGDRPLGSLRYGYDPGGRLSSVGGSLSRADLPGVFDDAQVRPGSRMTESGGSRIEYDDAGNITSVEDPHGRQTTYTWDARGRLVGENRPGGDARIGYDALGRRTSSTVGGKDYGFRYDGAELAAQDAPEDSRDLVFARGLDTDTAFAAISGSGDGRPDASGDPGALLTDRLGSVVARAEAGSPELTARYTYGLYGAAASTLDSDPNPVRFTGREAGPGTPDGLQYQRARWYSPQLGRFLSEDPAGHAGSGANLYSYGASDPVDVTDPTGQFPALVGACLVGGTLGVVTTALIGQKHSARDYLIAFGAGCVTGALGKFAQLRFAGSRLRTALDLAEREGADNVANIARMSEDLTLEEARSVFTASGGLKQSVIDESRFIIGGEKLENPAVIRELTSDGSNIVDWAKYTSRTVRSPSGDFQIHFYKNRITGEVNYNIDYKIKFNR
jgi:RHS repeat-associated protein